MFTQVYPIELKSKSCDALRMFINNIGVPGNLTVDGSKEQNGKNTKYTKQIRKHDIQLHVIELERHSQNPGESVIRELRRKWFRVMVRKRVRKKFWDYGVRWVAETMQRTLTKAGGLEGRCLIERVSGETTDISEYLDFGFYDWC